MAPSALRIALRPYQAEALERIGAAETRGVRRQLGVAATGLGKTIMFAALAAGRDCRTLVLVHRDELAVQAIKKLLEVWPELGATSAALAALAASGETWLADTTPRREDGVGLVKAGANDVRARVVVASVQTLGRQKRLEQLLTPCGPGSGLLSGVEPFGLVVVDEAHHSAADTYVRILAALEAHKPLVLGVTATPDRGDGKGLDGQFDEVVFSYDILWGIKNGYLADLRGLRIKVDHFELNDVKVRRGDYDQGQAGALMERAGADKLLVATWQEHAAGRPTLAFLPTVSMAEKVAKAYVMAGVPAAMVHAGTKAEERRAIVAAFKRGDLLVLTNCDVLSEGYDEARVSCIQMAAPTKARGRYVQRVGRGLRLHPEKDDCLVLDYVGATEDHKLVTVPSLYGLEREHRERFEGGGGTLTEALAAQQQEAIDLGHVVAEEAELFGQVVSRGIAWLQVPDVKFGGKRFVRPLGVDNEGNKLATVHLARRDAERDLWLAGVEHPNGVKEVLIMDVPLELAQGLGEDYVRKYAANLRHVVRDAKWRTAKPTAKQLDLARRVRIHVDPTWNAGQLSDAIDERFQEFERRRRRAKAKTA